jgi:hypothetical protein
MAEARERLTVCKQRAHRFYIERFNFQKLKDVEGKEKSRVEIKKGFAALENVDSELNVSRTWETIKENIKISTKDILGYYELKKHKP